MAVKRPVIVQAYPKEVCLHCRREFTPTRAWQKYDTPYCRMMHWHTENRRVMKAAQIVSVDGRKLPKPVDVVDPKMSAAAEARVSSAHSFKRR